MVLPRVGSPAALRENPMDCAMCWGWMMGGGGMVLGGVIAILFIVLLVLAIMRFTRS